MSDGFAGGCNCCSLYFKFSPRRERSIPLSRDMHIFEHSPIDIFGLFDHALQRKKRSRTAR